MVRKHLHAHVYTVRRMDPRGAGLEISLVHFIQNSVYITVALMLVVGNIIATPPTIISVSSVLCCRPRVNNAIFKWKA